MIQLKKSLEATCICFALASLFFFSSCAHESRHRERSPKKIDSRPISKEKSSRSELQRPEVSTSGVDQSPLDFFSSAELEERNSNWITSLSLYAQAHMNPKSPFEKQQSQNKMADIVENKISLEDCQKILDEDRFGLATEMSRFRMARNEFDLKNFSSARRSFQKVSDNAPGTLWAIQSADYIRQIEGLSTEDSRAVGVVLPLSGKNSAQGQRTLRALQMGLGLHQKNSSLRLAVMDSGGNPDLARRSVERLVTEDHVIAIVGSLTSKTAFSEANKANELGVPYIGLTQKAGLTDVGVRVFRNALTSQMQVRRLVEIAMAQGMRRFAILYPNDSYGVEYSNMFWNEVLARGGNIVGAQTYNPTDTDFRGPVQRLVGTFYIEARLEEYKARLKAQNESKPRSQRKNFNPDDILSPIVDFDGIFIPDSAKVMGQMAAFLSYAGVKSIGLLGTSLWNVPGLSKRAGGFSDRLLFVDSHWPGSKEVSSSRFVSEYKDLFGEDPSFLEFQSYDTGLLLRQLILGGADSRKSLLEDLSETKSFAGALGEIRLSKDREFERPVFALSLNKLGEIGPAVSAGVKRE